MWPMATATQDGSNGGTPVGGQSARVVLCWIADGVRPDILMVSSCSSGPSRTLTGAAAVLRPRRASGRAWSICPVVRLLGLHLCYP